MCSYCQKSGHSSANCTAKQTGQILEHHNLIKPLFTLSKLSVEQVNALRSKAPALSEELLTADYHDDIDILSDDEEYNLDSEENINVNNSQAETSVVEKRTWSHMTDNIVTQKSTSQEENNLGNKGNINHIITILVLNLNYLLELIASTAENEKLYCFCMKVSDDNLIACDSQGGCRHPYANGWFHMKCVGLTNEEIEEMEDKDFICHWCRIQRAVV